MITKLMATLPEIFQFLMRYTFHGFILFIVFSCHDEDIPKNEDVRTGLLEQINSMRKNGCTCGAEWMIPVPPLVWDVNLENAAFEHAADMHLNNYFDHLSLDGTPPITRAQNAGYLGDYVGEVIAKKYYSTKDVVKAWQESESHCRALMDSLYDEMGGARKEEYWVVDLGRSK